MLKLTMNLSIALASILLIGASPVSSSIELDSSNGSIRVSVTNANGKAAAGIQVRLFHARVHKKKAEPTASLIRIRRAGTGRHTAIAAGTTGNGGSYLFANIPPGDYMVLAGIPGGTTVGRSPASVMAGQETDVAVTLEPKKIKSGT